MDAFMILHRIDEIIVQLDLFTNYSQFCIPGILICLLISYDVYSRVLWRILEETNIPKLYKITTLHSLWMGSINLIISIMCFSQLSTLVEPLSSPKSSHPFFMNEILHAAKANFCQDSAVYNGSILNSNSSEGPIETVEEIEWTSSTNILIYIIYAELIHEVLLATRNKMTYSLYSRLVGLVFVASAARTRCPLLSIQGTYLMSINSSIKEIARALAAWKSYSQEDSDHKPSAVAKAVTFMFFVLHMVTWFSLMMFYMPFFIHKLPSVNKSDPRRLFLAYTYMAFLAYVMIEVGTSPLWTTIQCMGWCRRSSGITWRVLALSDCHLLNHYSPLVLKLYNIQVILDQRKAMFRNKMVQKHFASLEGRKRKSSSELPATRPASLLAAVKTVVALKKKIQRRMDERPIHSVTLEDLPQITTKVEDSNIETSLLDKEIQVALSDSRQAFNTGIQKPYEEKIPDFGAKLGENLPLEETK